MLRDNREPQYGKPSPGEIEARRQAKRARLSEDPGRQNRQLANALYAAMQPFASGFHNRGEIIQVTIAQRVGRRLPVWFVGFWGVGEKSWIDSEDIKLLEAYVSMREAVSEQYSPGAVIELIACDEHAKFNCKQGLNGNSENGRLPYLEGVVDEAHRLGFGVYWLSDLYKEWNLNIPDVHQPMERSGVLYDFWVDLRRSRIRNQLVESAGKHSFAGVEAEQAAYHYVGMRFNEAEKLAERFRGAVIIANGSKELAGQLLPAEMGHLYWHDKRPPAWFRTGVPVSVK